MDKITEIQLQVKICLISPLDSPHCQGLALSDLICLENSKNVTYLGGRCEQGKLLLSAQMGGRSNQRGGDVTSIWEAGVNRVSKCSVNR